MKILRTHLPDMPISKPLENKIKSKVEYHERLIGVAIGCLILIFLMMIVIKPMPTGQVATTATIFASAPHTCGVELEPGFNFVSLNCLTLTQSRVNVFNNTNLSKIHAVYEYNPFNDDKWRVYAPNLPWYVVNDLSTMSRTKGYIIFVNGSVVATPYIVSFNGTNITLVNYTYEGTEILFNGTIARWTTIYLKKGWNAVGYPSLINDTLPDVLGNVTSSVSEMRTYRNGTWLYYWPNGSGDLVNISPGDAFWMNLSQNDQWLVNKDRFG